LAAQVQVATPSRRLSRFWPAALIVVATFAAYHNTFNSPLFLDDYGSILDNQTIRNLRDLVTVFSPPPGMTVSGRPLLNFSLAINHAISGREVWSYHAVNILIHAAAGLTLFGFLHRTLLLPSLRERFGEHARPLALLAALLWTLHPLQTESVTYIVQRAESLMGLFYLLTLYCYLRSVDSPHAGRWQILSVASCALGMMTKEVMVTAPIVVLLHDRAFVAGSFREAWQKRKNLYLGLEATWAILGWLVASTGGNRNGTVGPGVDTAWYVYFLAQIKAVAHYIRLSFWPHPLCFEFGWFEIKSFAELAPSLAVIAPLFGLTLYGLWRHPKLGFFGAWFFGILALTSLMPGTTQIIVEHRMYLSLAAVVTGVLLATHAWFGRRCWPVWIVIIIALGATTIRRNHDYRSALALWKQTLDLRPEYGLANASYGLALLNEGRTEESLPYFEKSARLDPLMSRSQSDYAYALGRADRFAEAEVVFKRALNLNPKSADIHRRYGAMLSRMRRHREAMIHLDLSLKLGPEFAENYVETGVALGRAGHLRPALTMFEKALQLEPENANAHNNYGYALMLQGRAAEARHHFEEALRLNPKFSSARKNLDKLDQMKAGTNIPATPPEPDQPSKS
jgi:tetratricopeptide (TPR) repeat protein